MSVTYQMQYVYKPKIKTKGTTYDGNTLCKKKKERKKSCIVQRGLYCTLPCDKFTSKLQDVINSLSKIFFSQNKYNLKKKMILLR